MKSLSRVQLLAYQAPPSMGFSRQECWSGLPFPGIENRKYLRNGLWAECLDPLAWGIFLYPWNLSLSVEFIFTRKFPRLCISLFQFHNLVWSSVKPLNLKSQRICFHFLSHHFQSLQSLMKKVWKNKYKGSLFSWYHSKDWECNWFHFWGRLWHVELWHDPEYIWGILRNRITK